MFYVVWNVLCLLDLSAAFGCVDHDLLLHRLQLSFGLRGVALEWIRSYLTDCTQQIAYGSRLSTSCPLPFGVPQLVLGPLLYTLYTADLTYVVERHGIRLHQYADDSQVYISVPVSDVATATQTRSLCQFDKRLDVCQQIAFESDKN